jgi:transposase-like protein
MWGLFGDSHGEDEVVLRLSGPRSALRAPRCGATSSDMAWCNTNSPYSDAGRLATMVRCLLVLLTNDRAAADAGLDASRLVCPSCGGVLGPWGHARRRVGRGDDGTMQRPRRTRCRSCRVTHVVLSARRFPRRADSAVIVGTALLGAARGLGYRKVAELVDRPETTVRGWLRRARANSETVRADATVAAWALDPNLDWRHQPPATPLGTMVDALELTLGVAVAAWVRRFGPVEDPWAMAVQLTRGSILAAHPEPVWHGHI